MNPPELKFTEAESDAAFLQWKASCGPHSIAAACGKSLEEVRKALPSFRGWMNPTMVSSALTALGKKFTLRKGLKTQTLCNGINRIQWEGDWLKPGKPPAAAYHHTHYVAHVNGWVLCTTCLRAEWVPVEDWKTHLKSPTYPTFHITHHWSFAL